MPWKVVDVLDQRISFVVRALQPGANISALCAEMGISRPTGYRWLQRYVETGRLELLRDRSRRPHASPEQISGELERRVVALRQRFGWGARKLQVLLAREGRSVSVSTINRVMQRNGLLKLADRHRPAVRRFVREQPNQLWQMDFKGDYALAEGKCHPLVILDDHSRFALGVYALPSQRASDVHPKLIDTFERHGLPDQMLMDHGTPWWSTTNGHGLTWLSVSLIKQGVELHFGAIRHPQTQGKAERFNRTLTDAVRQAGTPNSLDQWEVFLAGFRQEYNFVRPHEAINMAVPADCYRPSARAYVPNGQPWDYPSGAIVHQLNSEGFVTHAGQRYFVCEALAREEVMVQPFADRLLVSFRHMHVREVDLTTGHSHPIVRPIPLG
jgi:transposase InsO family protein